MRVLVCHHACERAVLMLQELKLFTTDALKLRDERLDMFNAVDNLRNDALLSERKISLALRKENSRLKDENTRYECEITKANAAITRKTAIEIQLTGDSNKSKADVFETTSKYEREKTKAERFEALYSQQVADNAQLSTKLEAATVSLAESRDLQKYGTCRSCCAWLNNRALRRAIAPQA